MMKNTIYYICTYDNYTNNRRLQTQPSGVTKINYIKSALIDAGYNVYLYSIAECRTDCFCFNYPLLLNMDTEKQYYICSWGRKNYFLKYLSRFGMLVQLLFFLLFKINKDDKILVYHSLAIKSVIRFVCKYWKRKIYFEVEEIYNAVYKSNSDKILKEIDYLKGKEGYIFVNDIIQKKTKIWGKSAVCYGNYRQQTKKRLNYSNSEDFKIGINIIYAGVIGPKGSDVYLAVDLAKYLSEKYYIHILGYGSDDDCSELQNYIDGNKGLCEVIYHGCLLGDDYQAFLTSCQIGLCSRVLDNEYSDYTFPSKILVYLNNGLIPVCTPINCIKESKLEKYIVFSNNNSPEEIAKAIMKIDYISIINVDVLLTRLHQEFVESLRILLNS